MPHPHPCMTALRAMLIPNLTQLVLQNAQPFLTPPPGQALLAVEPHLTDITMPGGRIKAWLRVDTHWTNGAVPPWEPAQRTASGIDFIGMLFEPHDQGLMLIEVESVAFVEAKAA